jgi:ATP-dependent Clp protease ATP-binding subunit ClpX
MYDLPSMDEVSKVVADEGVIAGESDPLMIYEHSDKLAASD